jgi:hypothetical protein
VSARKLIMLSHFRSFRRFGVFAPFWSNITSTNLSVAISVHFPAV